MKTKDSRPFNFLDFNTTERDKYANTFRFEGMSLESLETIIKQLEEELSEKMFLIELAENINYTLKSFHVYA